MEKRDAKNDAATNLCLYLAVICQTGRVSNTFNSSLLGIPGAQDGCTVVLSTHTASVLIWLRKGFRFMKTPKDDSYYNIRENAGTILTDIKMISFLKQANKEGLKIIVQDNAEPLQQAMAFLSLAFICMERNLTPAYINFEDSLIRLFCTSKLNVQYDDTNMFLENGYILCNKTKEKFEKVVENMNLSIREYMSRTYSARDIEALKNTSKPLSMLETNNMHATDDHHIR